MAAITWYLTNASASVGSDLSTTDPGAEAYRSPVTGWIVSTGATNHSPWANDVEQAAATFVDTAPPDGSLDTTNGDFWVSPSPLTGDFAAANWSVHAGVRAQTNGGAQDGRMRCRLFRGPNQNGSGATEITAAQQSGGLVTDLGTAATQVSTATFNPGAFSVSGEYIFVQIGWERTGAGGMTTADVNARIGGASSCRVVTSDFSLVVRPDLISQLLSPVAPARIDLSVSPDLISQLLAVTAPTRIDLALAPGLVSSLVAAIAPTIQSDQSVSPALVSALLTPVAPSRIDQQVAGALVSGLLAAIAPSRVDLSVAPALLSQPLTLVAPTRIDQAVTVALITVPLSATAPTRIDQAVTPGQIAALLGVTAPVVSAGGAEQTVSPPVITQLLATLAPAVVSVIVGGYPPVAQAGSPTPSVGIALAVVPGASAASPSPAGQATHPKPE